MKIVLTKEAPKGALELRFLTQLPSQSSESTMLGEAGFSLKEGSTYLNLHKNILYIASRSLEKEDIKIAAAAAIHSLDRSSIATLCIYLESYKKGIDIKALVEGLLLGEYSYLTYKSAAKKEIKRKFHIIYNAKTTAQEELKASLDAVEIICESVNYVRDIVNTPPQDYYPKKMAKDAQKIAKRDGLECTILGEKALKDLGMNVMLSVGRASVHESQLIHLAYKPKNPKAKIVLLGKGLTYDSGGLSLKSGESMVSMKCDKAGGSAVLGIMSSLKALGVECEVHGIIGAVENMIGGDAYKPDDVLWAKNGMSIEVKNTDAEGRLVLADCLCYAQDTIKEFDYIFDFATLTGASIVALGAHTMALLGHNETLKSRVATAATHSGELVGFLPYNRYFEGVLDSEIADMINTASTRHGGAITASLFLNNFIQEKNKEKWLHFDIAGPAYVHKAWGYNPYGASGAGVRLILQFLKTVTRQSL